MCAGPGNSTCAWFGEVFPASICLQHIHNHVPVIFLGPVEKAICIQLQLVDNLGVRPDPAYWHWRHLVEVFLLQEDEEPQYNNIGR